MSKRAIAQARREFEKGQAIQAVTTFSNYISNLTSLHKLPPFICDWDRLLSAPPPRPPSKSDEFEQRARLAIQTFRPGCLGSLLGLDKPIRARLQGELEEAIARDRRVLDEKSEQYRREVKKRELAPRVLEGEGKAIVGALELFMKGTDRYFFESSNQVLLSVPNDACHIQATFCFSVNRTIPTESKSLLASGKLSEKKMTKTQSQEVHRALVCGIALRLASDIFGLTKVDLLFVHIRTDELSTTTGRRAENEILSVVFERKAFSALHLPSVDPFECVKDFVHRVNYTKSQGFAPIIRIDPDTYLG